MPLSTGSRIGPYEILSPLGAGGMGEVYRARDPRLDRSVAIKALSAGFVTDPDRRARFEREARVLASLNHPNIAGIYGIEEVEGTPYLILELVEGESLAQRLAQGPLSVRDTLDVASQVASAIEAAHEKGIVHRDLKPGNVMLTASRAVKVLDFGLAKGSEPASDVSRPYLSSPTVGPNVTGDGIILGTAAYMSPEQARGKVVDRRTDVWAFGCVLFECLSGHQAFEGETVSDVLARILERDPNWGAIPASVPAKLRDVTRRCLTKDAAERPRDIGDIRRELSAIAAGLSSPATAAATGTDRPSLAVLYFENPSNDSESDYFCAGITEDILTDLSKIKGLRVASRNAVARFRGAPADIPKIAAELGVAAVLEGSVRRAGERVRITAQLINAADGFHMWAERYDRTLADVFAVQEEIAHSIAEALRVALSPAESQSLVQDRPADVRAYDLYLKGRQRYGSYSKDSLNEALELFRGATKIDPEYALAYAGIADCYGQLCQWGYAEDPKEGVRLGLEAAARAIAINPQLAEAYKAQGLVRRFSGDHEGERAALRKAIEVNPRFVPALLNLAVEAFGEADVAGAERLIRRSLEIDPQETFATTWLAFICLHTSREDETLSLATRLRQLSSDPFYITAVYGLRGRIYLGRGDLAAAETAVREGRADGANEDNMRAVEAMIVTRSGRVEEAKRLVNELVDKRGIGTGTMLLLAGAALRVGEQELAIRYLDRRIVKDLVPTLARLDPELHPLLDREPFAPRRRDATLVWPLEAPMIDAARYALFREVRIESGQPRGSDVRPR